MSRKFGSVIVEEFIPKIRAMAKKRLLLIDGHSMAYRAFFALPAENFTTATGQHTNAIYGFATMLISLLKDEKPTHVAVAFDVSRKTFRTVKFFPSTKLVVRKLQMNFGHRCLISIESCYRFWNHTVFS
jgi:hypothetical protein